MKIVFNDGKELNIESYSNNGDELWVNVYTDDYNDVKKTVYNADKSSITLSNKNTNTVYDNYKDIVTFSSIVDEKGDDYITIIFKESKPDYKELLAEQQRLAKENEELKAKMAKIK